MLYGKPHTQVYMHLAYSTRRVAWSRVAQKVHVKFTCAHMCERRLCNMGSNTHSYIHILTVWSDSEIYVWCLCLSCAHYKLHLIHSQIIYSGVITNKDLKEVWELL